MSASRIPENPILFVDDERPVIDSLSLMLRSNGIDNIVACSEGARWDAMLFDGKGYRGNCSAVGNQT